MRTKTFNSEYYHIEYEHTPESLDKDKAKYQLHISFLTVEEAQKLFAKMLSWSLLVTLIENRIVIHPDGFESVSGSFSLGFKDEQSAYEFVDYFESSKTYNKRANELPISRIASSVKIADLIHPDFSIENRVRTYKQMLRSNDFHPSMLHPDFSRNNSAELIKKLSSFYLSVSDFLPKEIILLICHRILLTSNSFYETTQRFQLPQEEFSEPYKKIDCSFQWKASRNGGLYDGRGQLISLNLNLHLVCENLEETKLLIKNVKKSNTYKGQSITFCKKEIILPYHSYYLKVREKFPWEDGICVSFRYAAQAAMFNSLINFKDAGVELRGNSIRFPVHSLLNDKELVSLVGLPQSLALEEKKVENGQKPAFVDPSQNFGQSNLTLFAQTTPQKRNINQSTNAWEYKDILWYIPIIGWLILLICDCCCNAVDDVDEETLGRVNP